MQTYDSDTVKQNCLEYFNGDELAASVIQSKYLLKNKEDEYIEKSPEDLINRITDEFYRIEQKYPNSLSREEIYNALNKFKYIVPQGSPLFGIGNNYKAVSISNCFYVGGVEDSFGGIFEKDEAIAQIFKRRGGCGLDVSKLRPLVLKLIMLLIFQVVLFHLWRSFLILLKELLKMEDVELL